MLNITWVSARVCVSSRNAECESDRVAVGGKAPVGALEKWLPRHLGAGAVPGWGAAWEEIGLLKGKVGSPGSS